MNIEVTFNEEWKRLAGSRPLFRMAVQAGLRRAAAQALVEVGENFRAHGRPPWAPLSALYRRAKMDGKVQPGRQLASTAAGAADNTLTGALRIAALKHPRSRMGPDWIDLFPDPRIALETRRPRGGGPKPVGEYAGHVNRARPFMTIPAAAMPVVAEEFVIGLKNELFGVPQHVGIDLGRRD